MSTVNIIPSVPCHRASITRRLSKMSNSDFTGLRADEARTFRRSIEVGNDLHL